MPSDLLSTIRAEIVARLAELRPLILEYEQLLDASEALDSEGSASASSPASAPAGSGASASASSPASAPAGSGASASAGSGASASAGSTSSASASSGGSGRTAARRQSQASAAILAALEHGSHTAAELTVVTGLSAASIRRDLRLLLGKRAIKRTTREGKTAYALGT